MSSYTHICVVLDRSGSMESIRAATVGGYNAFLEQQKASPGAATLSLVQFDTEDPFEVLHSFVPLENVPELTVKTFVPRGSTPLLDAIGRTINATEAEIDKLAEFARPNAIVIAIITDGGENSSREFSRADVTRMIAEKEKLGWKFVFISSDLSAIDEACDTGIRASRTSFYDKSDHGTRGAWNSLSGKLRDLRSGKSGDIDFTQ